MLEIVSLNIFSTVSDFLNNQAAAWGTRDTGVSAHGQEEHQRPELQRIVVYTTSSHNTCNNCLPQLLVVSPSSSAEFTIALRRWVTVFFQNLWGLVRTKVSMLSRPKIKEERKSPPPFLKVNSFLQTVTTWIEVKRNRRKITHVHISEELLPLLKFYWVCECSNAAKFPAFKIDLLVLQQTQNKANNIVVLLTPPFLISLNGTTFLWMHSLYSENSENPIDSTV